jgi:hypothetical protein
MPHTTVCREFPPVSTPSPRYPTGATALPVFMALGDDDAVARGYARAYADYQTARTR